MTYLLVPEDTEQHYIDGFPEGARVGRLPSDGTLPDDAAEVEILVNPYWRHEDFLRRNLPKFTGLKLIQLTSAGVEWMTPFVPEGVTLCNGRGVGDVGVSEWIVGAVLALLKDIPAFVHQQETQEWRRGQTRTLANKRITILGYGSIGQELEKRLAPFGVTINRIGSKARDDGSGRPVQAWDSLDALLPETDILVILLPLTDQTKHLVNAAFLARLGDGAMVVNAARGAIVDTEALLAELNSGRLRAALDVTDPEPLPPGHALWTAKNVLLTQHTAGGTEEHEAKGFRLVWEQVRRYQVGEPLVNVISGEY